MENELAGNDLVARRIQQAVESQLAARGFRETDEETPVFYIAYHASTQERTELETVDNWGYRYPRSYWDSWGAEVRTRTYEEGTLVLDVINGTSNELVWRGIARRAVDPGEAKSTENVAAATEEMLEKFPPQRD